jgi:DNA-binding HxlR family transcriptional regulator
MNCSIARALEIVGEWWTLLIVREALLFGATRFGDFKRGLDIADNILTERLRRLSEQGIFERATSPNGSAHPEYRVTEMGEALFPVLLSLMQWGDRWISQAQGVPVKALERKSGREVPALAVRSRGGRSLTSADVILAPGSGATPATRARIERQAGKI